MGRRRSRHWPGRDHNVRVPVTPDHSINRREVCSGLSWTDTPAGFVLEAQFCPRPRQELLKTTGPSLAASLAPWMREVLESGACVCREVAPSKGEGDGPIRGRHSWERHRPGARLTRGLWDLRRRPQPHMQLCFQFKTDWPPASQRDLTSRPPGAALGVMGTERGQCNGVSWPCGHSLPQSSYTW